MICDELKQKSKDDKKKTYILFKLKKGLINKSSGKN